MLMWRSVKTSRTSSWPAQPSECCLDTNQHHHWTWTWHDGRLAEYESVFKYKVNTIYHTILARQGTWDVQGANCYWERWPTWLCCEEGMQLHGDRHSGFSYTLHLSLSIMADGCSLSTSWCELWKSFRCSLLISEKSFQTCGDSLEGECFTHNEVDRVAGLGRLSAGAKMAMKPFVKRVFTIFATNASFMCVIANLQI